MHYNVPNFTKSCVCSWVIITPSAGSSSDCVCCEVEDDKDSSLACDPSERRRGVQTPRSGLSLFLVRFSCFSVQKPCKSFATTLSSDTPFASLRNNCTFDGRGGLLSSWFEVWICASEWSTDGLWREFLLRSMLLIILPLASRRWFCLGTATPPEFVTRDAVVCFNDKPPGTCTMNAKWKTIRKKFLIVASKDTDSSPKVRERKKVGNPSKCIEENLLILSFYSTS